MDEFVAGNMLGWFIKINKRKSCCILLVVYIVVLIIHGHTNIKFICLLRVRLHDRYTLFLPFALKHEQFVFSSNCVCAYMCVCERAFCDCLFTTVHERYGLVSSLIHRDHSFEIRSRRESLPLITEASLSLSSIQGVLSFVIKTENIFRWSIILLLFSPGKAKN